MRKIKKRKCCGVISEGERLDMDIQIYRESKGEQDIVRERERENWEQRKKAYEHHKAV